MFVKSCIYEYYSNKTSQFFNKNNLYYIYNQNNIYCIGFTIVQSYVFFYLNINHTKKKLLTDKLAFFSLPNGVPQPNFVLKIIFMIYAIRIIYIIWIEL